MKPGSNDKKKEPIKQTNGTNKNPNSNGKELLYVAQRTAERTKKEVINKACEWLSLNMVDTTYIGLNSTLDKPSFIQRFKKAMEE